MVHRAAARIYTSSNTFIPIPLKLLRLFIYFTIEDLLCQSKNSFDNCHIGVKHLLARFLSTKSKRYRWSCQGEELGTGTAKLSAGLCACCAVVLFRNDCRSLGACYGTAHATRCMQWWPRRGCGSSRNRVPLARALCWLQTCPGAFGYPFGFPPAAAN